MEKPEDILLINKPCGMTSFDVIRRLRKTLGVKKMGHAGTLDPLAEGLMLVGVGAGTKKLAELIGLSKEYVAEIEFGARTSTGDREGEVLEEVAVEKPLSRESLEAVLSGFVGSVDLSVPAFSAIKQGGVPLYKLARRGESVDAPVRKMVIHGIELMDMRHEPPRAFATVRMEVGSGAYVRSIAEEIGRRVGMPATLSALKRTKIGMYSLENAQELE